MPDGLLQGHLAAERAEAVRWMLRHPLLDSRAEPEAFRLVARHVPWLTNYFEGTCGWALALDVSSGFARLAKRPAEVDVTRPLRRRRGEKAPFDRRRYQLLCLVCAELVRNPVTTISLLARSVTAEGGLDSTRHSERSAFVDALGALTEWGALEVSSGDVDAFVGSERANALLNADTALLHRLLVSTLAPSSLPDDLDTESATRRLLEEPRYGTAADDPVDGLGEESRNRWARHRLGRRILDDPVLHLDDLSDTERTYLSSLSGRQWARDRVAAAGMQLEERADGLMAVDPDAIATDSQFPAPAGNAHQLALLLADRLIVTQPDGSRQPTRLSEAALQEEVDAILQRFPGWARGQREEGGPERLARLAVDVLVSFGLARREGNGSVAARPALARYRTGEPMIAGASSPVDTSSVGTLAGATPVGATPMTATSLFEED